MFIQSVGRVTVAYLAWVHNRAVGAVPASRRRSKERVVGAVPASRRRSEERAVGAVPASGVYELRHVPVARVSVVVFWTMLLQKSSRCDFHQERS